MTRDAMAAAAFAGLAAAVLAIQGIRLVRRPAAERFITALAFVALAGVAVLWQIDPKKWSNGFKTAAQLAMLLGGTGYLGWLGQRGLEPAQRYQGVMRLMSLVFVDAFATLRGMAGTAFFAERLWLAVPAYIAFVGTILHGWVRRSG